MFVVAFLVTVRTHNCIWQHSLRRNRVRSAMCSVRVTRKFIVKLRMYVFVASYVCTCVALLLLQASTLCLRLPFSWALEQLSTDE